MPIPADSNGRSYRPRPIMRMHMRQTRGRSSSRITGMPIAILKAYITPTCPYTARKLSSLITDREAIAIATGRWSTAAACSAASCVNVAGICMAKARHPDPYLDFDGGFAVVGREICIVSASNSHSHARIRVQSCCSRYRITDEGAVYRRHRTSGAPIDAHTRKKGCKGVSETCARAGSERDSRGRRALVRQRG